MLTVNGNNRSKSTQMISNRKAYKSEEVDEQPISRRFERRNASPNTSAVWANANTSCPKHSYQQLAERVRELEREIVPDRRLYQLPQGYSPFSAATPCSNISGGGFPPYSNRRSFSMNLTSPNLSSPTQRFGLSSKILERAHQIPERFWLEWQQKQMQNRLEELEYIKNNLISPNSSFLSDEINPLTINRRKSLLLLHNARHHVSFPQHTTPNRSSDNESSDDHSSFSFDQRSIDDSDTVNLNESNKTSPEPIPPVRKSQPTLDRSRLTIYLPFAYTNMRTPTVPSSSKEDNLVQTTSSNVKQKISPTSSVEDVAQIDTVLNLTLLSRENQEQTNPLLYSKAIINRTVEFRTLSPRTLHTSLMCKNDTLIDEEVII